MPFPSQYTFPGDTTFPGGEVDLLTALRDHLVSFGIVRKPSVAGTTPPLWLEPMEGLRGPKKTGDPAITTEDSTDLVLGAFLTGGIAPGRFESWWRQPIIDIRFRGWRVPLITAVEMAISRVLIDRVGWTMAGLYVVEAEQWRALQRLGSDDQGFEYVSSYRFILYRP